MKTKIELVIRSFVDHIVDLFSSSEYVPSFERIVIINGLVMYSVSINDILGGILTGLSILYLLWRWRRDYRKDSEKKEASYAPPDINRAGKN